MPQGTTPRSIVVHLKGALTRSCKPGDAVSIAGVFLPEPYAGFRAMRAGLLTSTYLDAMGVTQLKQSYQQHAMDKELQDRMYVSRPTHPKGRMSFEGGSRTMALIHAYAPHVGGASHTSNAGGALREV